MNSYRRPVHFRRSRIPKRKNKFRTGINAAVLFVVIFVIVCIVGTVMLGNYLLDRAEETAGDTVTTPPPKETETTKMSDGLSQIEPADGSVRSGCLDIFGIKSADALDGEIRRILAAGYDSITVPVSQNGELLYYSPTAVALSHMDAASALPSLDSVIQKIKNIGREYSISPTVTLYYTLSSLSKEDPVLQEASFLFETAITTELVSYDADEVLISGFSLSENASDGAEKIISFTEKMKDQKDGTKLGISLTYEVFADNSSAHLLEKLSSAADFMAVDLTYLDWTHTVSSETVYDTDENGISNERIETVHITPIYEEIIRIADMIKGSTSLYGLRFLLRGDIPYSLSEAISALSYSKAYDFYVITPSPLGEDPEDEPETEDTADDTTRKNDSKDTKPPKETEPKETEKDTTKETTAETTAPPETEEETTIDPNYWEWYM